MSKFTHLDDKDQPKMVDVSSKGVTLRTAKARAIMFLGEKLITQLTEQSGTTKKGPVFQTAVVAGIQAVKRTAELIPMCHTLLVSGTEIDINITDNTSIEIECQVTVEGKTGVEMEALTGASVAALTVYDMCKSVSRDMVIRELKLIEKTGGKSDYRNTQA
jgi:cyclic pyranopterin phosphate synthase